MILQRCYKYRIRPTSEQEEKFRRMSGCRRVVWNYFLWRRRQYYQETKKTLSYADMCRELTALKKLDNLKFLNECDSQVLQQVLKDLCRAYVNFFEKRSRFPKRKSLKNTPNAFRIPQRVFVDGNTVYIPKVGKVEMVLHRSMEGEIKSATIKQEANGKWNICFVSHFEIPDIDIQPNSDNVIGLDAGLETFVTTSEGEKVKPPKFYRKQERKLRKVQRRHSRKKKGSRNRDKARRRVAYAQARTRNRRNDFLHKLSRKLCDKYDVICIEDLAISALVKTKLRGHGKSWTDVAWGAFRRQLEYKHEWRNRQVIAVNRWFPSSQECSNCREYPDVRHDMSVREWTCGNCGYYHDRDHNAAKNIRAEGLRNLAGGNPDSINACGVDVRLPMWKQLAMKQEVS